MTSPLRFSLSTLIGAIVLVALYLAAARNSTTLAAEAALTLTVALLAAGLLWGIFRAGADRLFWAGFQLCGWGYLLLAYSSWSQAPVGSYLLTTHLAAALHSLMPFDAGNAMVEWGGSWWPAEVLSRSGGRYLIHYTGYASNWDEWVGASRIRGPINPFLQICHAFLTLIMALTGGVLTRCLSALRWPKLGFVFPLGVSTAGALLAGMAGMVYTADLANSISLSLLLVALFLATLAVLADHGPQRTFALGFALMGWGYLLLHLGPVLETSVGPHLLTTTGLTQLEQWLRPPATPVAPQYGMTVYGTSAYVRGTLTTPPGTSSVLIGGHAMLGAMFALMGGCIARWLSPRKPMA